MIGQLVRASGYLWMLVAPVLLVYGLQLGAPWLAAAMLFGVFPLLRALYGDTRGREPEWSEGVSTFLDLLPMVYVAVMIGTLVLTLFHVHTHAMSAGQWAGLGVSMWATFAFGSCVGHELLHHQQPAHRMCGRVVAGVIGYPFLEHEHRTHHGSVGDSDRPEWPLVTESVYAFAARRSLHVIRTAWNSNLAAAERRGSRYFGGLATAAAASAATAAAFVIAGGWAGLVTYIAVALGVHVAIQAITYLQHWGLGKECSDSGQRVPLSWEDTCRLQRWVTLGISLHFAHHRNASIPYYLLQPAPSSPRLPASYVVMLYLSLVPPLWFRAMVPVLERWKESPDTQPTAGRRLVCFSL